VVSSGEKGAVGETMNLAARLQTIAQPSSVVVSERVRRFAGVAFDYEDLGEQSLKGIPQPTRAYRILGVLDDDQLLAADPASDQKHQKRERRRLRGHAPRLAQPRSVCCPAIGLLRISGDYGFARRARSWAAGIRPGKALARKAIDK
jgi:hypothetical protein